MIRSFLMRMFDRWRRPSPLELVLRQALRDARAAECNEEEQDESIVGCADTLTFALRRQRSSHQPAGETEAGGSPIMLGTDHER
jgi:hypothetical protein